MKTKAVSCNHLKQVLDESIGEQVCSSCGQVTEQKMVSYGSEPRYDDYMKNTRTGPKTSITFHDRGLSTIISRQNTDSTGKSIGFAMKPAFFRMRLWDSRIQAKTTRQRNMRLAMLELAKLKEKMSLSDAIIERAAYLYRKAAEKGLVRGRSVRSMVGACMYAACRDMDTHRTIIEISSQLHEGRKKIAKGYRILFNKLSLTVPVPDPIMIIVKIANNLDIPEKTKRDAVLMFDELRELKVTAGKKPAAVAATVIYMACIKTRVNKSQNQISKASGVTKITIRNRFKEFSKYVKLV